MLNLRRQLLLSHLLLIGLMLALLLGGVARFFHLGRSIDRVLDANVKSVLLMQQAKDALAAQPVRTAEVAAAIAGEQANLTEPGERELADALEGAFARYRTGAVDRAQVAQRAQAILELNLIAMRRADARAKAEARQSAVLGALATGGAALLAVALALRAVGGALLPLVSLSRQAEEIGAGRLNQRIELNRSDEIGALASAFNGMSERLAEARAALEARLVRAERMNDAALESLYDPVLVTDADGRIAHLNQAAAALFGPRLGAAVGDAKIAHALDRALRTGRPVAAEDASALVALAGKTYRLRVSPMQTPSQKLGAVAVLEDVTSLREVDRLKTEFIAVASHELRTPVTSLLLSVQLLQEGAVGALTPAQADVVQTQREDLDRLQQLLHNLLDLSRLESGVTAPRRVDVALDRLLSGVQSALGAEASAKGVALERGPDTGLVIDADPEQIERVLSNLVGNAVRHTPAGGSVRLVASARAGDAVVEVRDTGEGIPREYLSAIFERFTQVPGATRGGAGLGLSMARTLVEAHGGTIEAHSDGDGKGSVFTLTLPLASGKERDDGENTGRG